VDELWQRFRTFWTPVLWGIGVFLAGLIAVHVMSPDPEAGVRSNAQLSSAIAKTPAPVAAQISRTNEAADLLEERVLALASRLDQRRGEGKDPEQKDLVRTAAADALAAAILRGAGDPKDFDGDAAAAAEARTRYDRALEETLELLRTQDPNVGYSRLQAEVVQELSVRANRADVDVEEGEFGLASVTSIDRADLPRRLSNLALVARFVDLAVRSGVRSIGAITFPTSDAGEQGASDAFLSLWPVRVSTTARPEALRRILDVLTDPERPTAVGPSTWEVPGRKSDLVQCSMTLYSVRARPTQPLRLETEQ
jgi:hypothetical protein